MKKIFLYLFCFCSAQMLFGQGYPSEYKDFIKKADTLFKVKDYQNAALAYSSAFQSYGWKGSPKDRYNAARAWALANNPDSAFFSLDRIATKAGYDEYDKVVNEKDFNSLHQDARWQPLLVEIKKNKLPEGWRRNGNMITSYQMRLDSASGQEGKNALTIKSIESDIDGYGTLAQSFSAAKYSGKRIRMTGYMKTKDVADWASFWLRINQAGSQKYLSLDSMKDRVIKGTTEWKKYEIVLDVPKEASNISFGAWLHGTGQIWFEKLNFEKVGKSVPTTGAEQRAEPNLDFDK